MLTIAWLTWLTLGYIVPWIAVLQTPLRPALLCANGTWFIWVVASQSVAVLAATLEPALGQGRREVALLAVFSWSVGVFLYGAVGVLVAARMLYYPLRPEDLTPPYWVAMGATAITVLAGARIVEMANAPMVAATRGLVAGTSVVFWAFGSWLLAPLLGAGIWRHVVHRVPLRYEAALWSVVFPLGMYGVGGDYLGQADRLPLVEHIGDIESWVALAVWTVTFFAMLHHLAVTIGFGSRIPRIRICHDNGPHFRPYCHHLMMIFDVSGIRSTLARDSPKTRYVAMRLASFRALRKRRAPEMPQAHAPPATHRVRPCSEDIDGRRIT